METFRPLELGFWKMVDDVTLLLITFFASDHRARATQSRAFVLALLSAPEALFLATHAVNVEGESQDRHRRCSADQLQ